MAELSKAEAPTLAEALEKHEAGARLDVLKLSPQDLEFPLKSAGAEGGRVGMHQDFPQVDGWPPMKPIAFGGEGGKDLGDSRIKETTSRSFVF